MSKHKRKEKITYVDDGRTIADVSGVTGGMGFSKPSQYRPRSSFKEQWTTYWTAVKMMLRPMLVVVVGIILIYIVMTFIFWLA